MSVDVSDGSKYGNRDNQSRGRGYSSYGSSDTSDNYGSYGGVLVRFLAFSDYMKYFKCLVCTVTFASHFYKLYFPIIGYFYMVLFMFLMGQFICFFGTISYLC